jgi:drug/metabolite transporter (DMT)-like permease
MLSILFGLTSAISWGAADFMGGLASRKAKAYQAVLWGEAFGLLLLLGVSLFSGEALPPLWVWGACALAGSMGVLGLLLFFHAMRSGQMSVVAPVSALTAAILPVIIGSFMEGFPGWLTFAGFGLALASIWFISRPEVGRESLRLRLTDLALPLIAGASFGIYLVLIERGSQEHTFWPLVASRLAGSLTMLVYAGLTRQPLLPPRGVWRLVMLNGVLDVTGNFLYILAGQMGRMDTAAVLASLYPGSTVLLARIFLRERLGKLQVAGIVLALAAVVLMTL